MTIDIQPTPQALEAAEQAGQVLARARAYSITTPAEYAAVGADLKAIKGRAKELEDLRLSMSRPINESLKRINDFFRVPAAHLADAEREAKRAIAAYDAEQQRIRQEAERKAREEAERLRKQQEAEAARIEQAAREKREREEAKARELEAQGRQAEAEAKRAAADRAEAARIEQADAKRVAAEMIPAAPVVHLEQPKVAGVSSRQAWKFEITDPKAIPREYLVPDEKAIGAVVRALGARASIEGVRIFQETIISSRSA